MCSEMLGMCVGCVWLPQKGEKNTRGPAPLGDASSRGSLGSAGLGRCKSLLPRCLPGTCPFCALLGCVWQVFGAMLAVFGAMLAVVSAVLEVFARPWHNVPRPCKALAQCAKAMAQCAKALQTPPRVGHKKNIEMQ